MSAENGGPRDGAKKISAGGVKKGKNEGQKVITGNRLTDGVVVYFTDDDMWTEDIDSAEVVEGDVALTRLDVAVADEAHVVGPYLMDVSIANGQIVPAGRGLLRETIREAGPTIHPQFSRRSETVVH